jgi:hypothetical protein
LKIGIVWVYSIKEKARRGITCKDTTRDIGIAWARRALRSDGLHIEQRLILTLFRLCIWLLGGGWIVVADDTSVHVVRTEAA